MAAPMKHPLLDAVPPIPEEKIIVNDMASLYLGEDGEDYRGKKFPGGAAAKRRDLLKDVHLKQMRPAFRSVFVSLDPEDPTSIRISGIDYGLRAHGRAVSIITSTVTKVEIYVCPAPRPEENIGVAITCLLAIHYIPPDSVNSQSVRFALSPPECITTFNQLLLVIYDRCATEMKTPRTNLADDHMSFLNIEDARGYVLFNDKFWHGIDNRQLFERSIIEVTFPERFDYCHPPYGREYTDGELQMVYSPVVLNMPCVKVYQHKGVEDPPVYGMRTLGLCMYKVEECLSALIDIMCCDPVDPTESATSGFRITDAKSMLHIDSERASTGKTDMSEARNNPAKQSLYYPDEGLTRAAVTHHWQDRMSILSLRDHEGKVRFLQPRPGDRMVMYTDTFELDVFAAHQWVGSGVDEKGRIIPNRYAKRNICVRCPQHEWTNATCSIEQWVAAVTGPNASSYSTTQYYDQEWDGLHLLMDDMITQNERENLERVRLRGSEQKFLEDAKSNPFIITIESQRAKRLIQFTVTVSADRGPRDRPARFISFKLTQPLGVLMLILAILRRIATRRVGSGAPAERPDPNELESPWKDPVPGDGTSIVPFLWYKLYPSPLGGYEELEATDTDEEDGDLARALEEEDLMQMYSPSGVARSKPRYPNQSSGHFVKWAKKKPHPAWSELKRNASLVALDPLSDGGGPQKRKKGYMRNKKHSDVSYGGLKRYRGKPPKKKYPRGHFWSFWQRRRAEKKRKQKQQDGAALEPIPEPAPTESLPEEPPLPLSPEEREVELRRRWSRRPPMAGAGAGAGAEGWRFGAPSGPGSVGTVPLEEEDKKAPRESKKASRKQTPSTIPSLEASLPSMSRVPSIQPSIPSSLPATDEKLSRDEEALMYAATEPYSPSGIQRSMERGTSAMAAAVSRFRERAFSGTTAPYEPPSAPRRPRRGYSGTTVSVPMEESKASGSDSVEGTRSTPRSSTASIEIIGRDDELPIRLRSPSIEIIDREEEPPRRSGPASIRYAGRDASSLRPRAPIDAVDDIIEIVDDASAALFPSVENSDSSVRSGSDSDDGGPGYKRRRIGARRKRKSKLKRKVRLLC